MPSLPNGVTVMDKRKERKGKEKRRGEHIHREKSLEFKRKKKYWTLWFSKDPDIRRSLYLV